jgi:hypothetical protein
VSNADEVPREIGRAACGGVDMRVRTRTIVAGLGASVAAMAGCDEPLGFAWDVRSSPGFADVPTRASAPEVPTVEGPCAIADAVFTPYCVECHDGATAFPDLRAGALGRLAGLAAEGYPGQTLVVPGHPGASFLYLKMHAPAAGQGKLMPPAGAVPPELLGAVAAWITAGAPACAGVADPGPAEPILPVPGGAITFGAPPSGYQTSAPAWAEHGTCTPQQWWKYQGDTESANMHPGVACIDCHTRTDDGPVFSYAGTIFANVADTDDCRGVTGVAVEILDAAGQVLGRAVTNAAGNFSWRASLLPFRADYRARLTFQGRTREMKLPQPSNGDCNTCHDSTGSEGAPGRMVAP